MAITGYEQTMRVDTEASLPTMAAPGSFAFAEDTGRHYMYTSSSWFKIPNTVEISSPRYYLNGIAQNGTAKTGEIVEWVETCTTAGGTTTSYITTEGAVRTPGGTALCSTILADSIQTNFIDSTGVYAQGSPTITSNKTVSVPFTKQGFNGVTVVGINVLGSASMGSIPNGVTVKLRLIGIAA